jgi:hypothetical protein
MVQVPGLSFGMVGVGYLLRSNSGQPLGVYCEATGIYCEATAGNYQVSIAKQQQPYRTLKGG